MAWSKTAVTYGYKVKIDLEKIVDEITARLPGEVIDWYGDADNIAIEMEHNTGCEVWHCPATRESPAEWEAELKGSVEETTDIQGEVLDVLHRLKRDDISIDLDINDSDEWIFPDDDEPDPDRAYDEWRNRQYEE